MNDTQQRYKKRGVDYAVAEVMLTLPRDYYQSEAIYQEELEKIFYQRWLMVCREEEIPAPGDFLTVLVGEESIMVVRYEHGQIHAHFNVCRHRGTRICMEEIGQFASGFIRRVRKIDSGAEQLQKSLSALPCIAISKCKNKYIGLL